MATARSRRRNRSGCESIRVRGLRQRGGLGYLTASRTVRMRTCGWELPPRLEQEPSTKRDTQKTRGYYAACARQLLYRNIGDENLRTSASRPVSNGENGRGIPDAWDSTTIYPDL